MPIISGLQKRLKQKGPSVQFFFKSNIGQAEKYVFLWWAVSDYDMEKSVVKAFKWFSYLINE